VIPIRYTISITRKHLTSVISIRYTISITRKHLTSLGIVPIRYTIYIISFNTS